MSINAINPTQNPLRVLCSLRAARSGAGYGGRWAEKKQ